jgi:hypothetical protein
LRQIPHIAAEPKNSVVRKTAIPLAIRIYSALPALRCS